MLLVCAFCDGSVLVIIFMPTKITVQSFLQLYTLELALFVRGEFFNVKFFVVSGVSGIGFVRGAFLQDAIP